MTDLELRHGDVAFDDTGELAVIEGTMVVAQDVVTAFTTTRGALHWDDTAGSAFPLALNAVDIQQAALEAEAQDILLADDRIDPDDTSVLVVMAGGATKVVADFRVSGIGMARAEAVLGGSNG